MIGPTNSGSEGYARRLNRKDWMDENRDRPLTQAEETVFCVVLCTMLGAIGALALVAGIQAECSPSL